MNYPALLATPRAAVVDKNIDAMVDSAAEHGEYPITIDPGSRPPVYESFVTSSFPLKPDSSAATGNGSNTGTDLPEFTDVAARTRDGDVQAVRRLVGAHLDDGASREDVREALRAGLRDAEARFWNEGYYYPEILQADRAYRAGVAAFDSLDDRYRGTAVIGALRSIFESGNIVVEAILHGAGLRVVDLGANVSPQEFVDEAERVDADVIGWACTCPETPRTSRRSPDCSANGSWTCRRSPGASAWATPRRTNPSTWTRWWSTVRRCAGGSRRWFPERF